LGGKCAAMGVGRTARIVQTSVTMRNRATLTHVKVHLKERREALVGTVNEKHRNILATEHSGVDGKDGMQKRRGARLT